MRAAFRRRDEQQAPVGKRQELAVEEVRADGVGQRQLVVGDHHGRERAADGRAQRVEHRRLVDERALVAEQERAFADGDDVVVEDAGVDAVRALLREHRSRGIEPVAARDGFAGLARLPGRIARWRGAAAEPAASVDEELDAGLRRRRMQSACGWRHLRRRTAAPPAADRGRGSASRRRRSRAESRVVVGASSERWKFVTRFAGVKCSRPSAQSAAALTVAAFATHIDAADEHAARRSGASRAAAAITS